MNDKFSKVVKETLLTGLANPRSTEKLNILHSCIAKDLLEELNKSPLDDVYEVYAKGLDGKYNCELKVDGYYYNKDVDITIVKNSKIVAGIEVKFPLSSFNKNANNLFESLLGNTANLRMNKDFEYFQFLVFPNRVPLFENSTDNQNKKIKRFENIDSYQLDKYIKLSKDDNKVNVHSPTKTFLYYFNLPDLTVETNKEYMAQLKSLNLTVNDKYIHLFGKNTIVNDYNKFIFKVAATIWSK